MNKRSRFNLSNVIDASVIGGHCIYVKIYADMPANLLTLFFVNKTNLSANFFTAFSLIFMVISCFFIVQNNLLIGALAFYLGFLFDFIDGKISRLRRTASNYGKKLDLFADRFGFFLVSLSYFYFFLNNGHIFELYLLIFFSLMFFLFDSIELTNILVKYRDESEINGKIERKEENEKYFYAFTSIKRWLPSRVGSLGLVFVFGPLINFNFFLLICILSTLIRLIRLLIDFFEVLESR